jgi:preprotein translocase subunit SecD
MPRKIANTLIALVGLALLTWVLGQIASSTRSQIWTLETIQPLDPDHEAATTNILRRRALSLHPAFSPIIQRSKGDVFTVRVRGELPVASVAEEVLTRSGVFGAHPVAEAEAVDSQVARSPSLVGNEHIVDARVKVGDDQQPRVEIRLSAQAQARLLEFFEQSPGGRLDLAVDGEVGARATARELRGPLLVYDPGWKAKDGDSAFALAAILEGGPLPVALRLAPSLPQPR